MNLILGLFSWIDFFIHTGIAEVFKLIFRIAEVDIFTEEAIATFANRIYGILGVLILFKIVISCIQYLVSPDKMADKDKGMGALITRTIISFCLLALVPTIFSFAKKVETNIAGVIPTIILGQNVDYRTQDGETPVEKVGSWMSFVTLKAFVTEKEDKKTEIANKNLKMENFDDFKKNIMVGCGVFSLDGCVYDYNVVFSILVGVFMLWILITMGADIAVRTIKLGILQILAPIPIASYINGQENFKTWYQTSLKVYAELFTRLIVIYFIVYIMATIGSGGMSIGFLTDPFVVIYIIIGLLMFAKQAPKFICDVLGIKSDGFGDIGNMFKRAGGLAGTALGVARDGIAAYSNKKKSLAASNGGVLKEGGKAEALRTAFRTAGASARSGFSGFINNKGFKETMSANQRAARKNYEIHDALESNGRTMWDYHRESFNRMMGFESESDIYKKEAETARKLSDAAKSSIDLAASLIPQKMSSMALDAAAAEKFMEVATGSKNGSLTIGFDRDGNSIRVTASDLTGTYNPVTGRMEARFSVATIMNYLEKTNNSKASDYGVALNEDEFNAVQSRYDDVSDALKGVSGSFVLSHTNEKEWLGRGTNNPSLLNSIQQSVSTYFSTMGTAFADKVTEYGKSVIKDSAGNVIKESWLNDDGSPKNEYVGAWFDYVKTEGLRQQTEALKKGDPAEGIVKDIYDRYSDKK